jgi:hypothetical protein
VWSTALPRPGGLVASWWAEFNDDFRPHEIPYFADVVVEGDHNDAEATSDDDFIVFVAKTVRRQRPRSAAAA